LWGNQADSVRNESSGFAVQESRAHKELAEKHPDRVFDFFCARQFRRPALPDIPTVL
jgi:hypothetical protein